MTNNTQSFQKATISNNIHKDGLQGRIIISKENK